MVWSPPAQRNPDTPRGGSDSKLSKAIKIVAGILEANNLSWKAGKELRDNFGRYSVTGDAGNLKLIVLARKYIIGSMVSAGGDVFDLGIRENRKLLIYISDINKIYMFDLKKCLKESQKSVRQGGKPFYDFPIKLGVNFVEWISEKNLLVGYT